MYAGSNSGQMYALDTTTGKILWNFASGGSVIDGPSIVDGTLYWGSGYREIAGTGNNKVFAFSLAGAKEHGGQSGDDHDHSGDDHSGNRDGQKGSRRAPIDRNQRTFAQLQIKLMRRAPRI